jgi:hypothetical protein
MHPQSPFARYLGTLALIASVAEMKMHIDIVMIQPLVALLFGIMILILPRLLNYLIAIYLILVGLTGLFPHLFATTLHT